MKAADVDNVVDLGRLLHPIDPTPAGGGRP